MSQSSILLRKPWRDFIAALPPPVEIGDDGVLRADGYYAARRDDKLVLAGVDGVREYVLPAGGGLRFEIEACVDEASCIVLVIETNARDWQRRIVAVPRVSGSDAGVALTGMEANR